MFKIVINLNPDGSEIPTTEIQNATSFIAPDDPVYSTIIADNILSYLENWKIDDTNTNHTVKDSLDNMKTVTTVELTLFFNKAINYTKNYLNLNYIPDKSQVLESICMWTAGLLYRKYNIRVDTDTIDNTPTIGYGDQLIIDAKSNLKSFIYSDFNVF